MQLNEKEPTLGQENLMPLFKAKCVDLRLNHTVDQLHRFTENCNKRNVNGHLTFVEMKLGVNFASALADLFYESPSLRITHLNLERNILGDSGVIKLVQAIRDS